MREFLVALNARFTSIIEKGLVCGLGVCLDRVPLYKTESRAFPKHADRSNISHSSKWHRYDVASQVRAHSGTGFSTVFLRGIPSFDKAKNGKLKES